MANEEKNIPDAISKELEGQKEDEKKNEDPRKGLPANVVVEEASAPMDLKIYDKDAEGPWIQYNGVGTVRVLTPEDWQTLGIDCDEYYEWNYMNQKRIPRSAFSDEVLQYLLRVDGRFSLVDE